jgi:hypothetical protein
MPFTLPPDSPHAIGTGKILSGTARTIAPEIASSFSGRAVVITGSSGVIDRQIVARLGYHGVIHSSTIFK